MPGSIKARKPRLSTSKSIPPSWRKINRLPTKAISSFLSDHPEVYDGDNQTVLLNEGGYELLQEYLATKPEGLKQLLQRSIPGNMHRRLGIDTFGWVERLCGENGVLEIAVQDFRDTIAG